MTAPAPRLSRCSRSYDRKLRTHPPAPLRVGGHAIYRRGEDTRLMRVTAIAGGVAKLERDGCRFEEACAAVRGVKL